MRVKFTVYTPVGTFENDPVELSTEQTEKLKVLFNLGEVAREFSMVCGGKSVFLPAETVRKSVVMFERLDK